MASLADFNNTAPQKLTDFISSSRNAGSGVNSSTVTNVASHAAVLGNEQDVLKNYTLVSSELSMDGSTSTLDELLAKNQTIDKQLAYEEMQRILRDPNMDKEMKARFMDGYINMTTDQTDSRSLSVLVAQNASQLPQSEDENDETVETSMYNVLADGLDEVDSYKGWVQSQINLSSNLKDRDFFNVTVDFLETMVPFLEPAATAKVQAAREQGVGGVVEAMTLLGQSKDAIRKSIANMPVDQRRDVAQKLIDIVKNGGGSWTLRRNELNMINQLNQFLVSDSYSDLDQVTDNIFSLMDVVLPVAGWGAKVLRAGKTAKITAANMKRAEAVAEEASVAAVEETVAALPRSDLDNIIDGSKGFDKATSDEIGNARNTIGYGLADGKSIDEIIASDPVFKKFTPEELEELKSMIVNRTVTPASDDTVSAMKDMIADRIINSLEQLDEVSYDKIASLREEIGKVVTRGAVANPKKLTADVMSKTKAYLRSQQLEAMSKEKVKGLVKELHEQSNVSRLSVRTGVDHTSLSQTLKDANAGKARATNAMMEADPSDKAARALYGTSRADAIANDRLPEVASVDGSVRNKVRMTESDPSPNQAVIDNALKSGRTDLDQAEKTQQRTQVKDAFKEVVGLTPRAEMSTVADTPSGASFDMVYGPTDGGFRNAQQALNQVLIGLRKYGVKGDEVELLAKDSSGKYVPIKGVPSEDGNYLVRVKYNYEFTPTDVVDYSLLGNKKYKMFESRTNLTDGTAGSVLEHIIPASSIINRVIFNSASVAADRFSWITKNLVNLASVYSKKYKKLSPRQKALVDEYRIEANAKGIAFTTANLKARGFDDAAIDTMRSWKETTDTMYHLENVDVNKTLRSRGWERFTDQINDTDLIARPKSNRFGDSVKAYDPGSNTVRVVERKELEELYANNGTIGELKEPLQMNDELADYIIVPNNETGYLRRIRDDDRTLNYRDGYYPVKYTDPIFIEKQFRKKDGSVYNKAIATAGSHADAKALIERLKSTDAEGVYNPRYDYKRGTQNFDDADWSVAVSGGRSAQRVRGKRLGDANSITDLNHANVESPEESLIHSIRSLASRTAFRDWIETTKSRWMANYGDMVAEQKGQIMWPSDVRLIGAGSISHDLSKLQDAKTTWRYVRAMEAGYVNLVDDLTKVFFQNVSDTVGSKKGWGWLEKGASKLSEVSPTAFARKKAFRLLLAANPLRQLPVQAMQALPILMATNPLAIPKITSQMIMLDYLANGGDAASFMKGVAKAATGMDAKSASKLAEDWKASGFEASVEANSLIRDQLSSLVDRTFLQKAGSVAGKPIDLMQKVGFNLGEQILMRSVWLSEYDLAIKAGKKMNAEDLDNLNARVRNLTLNMNKAGELPYNENSLSVAMQFFQAPHKAWAQVALGHTGLSGADRIKLGTSYVLTYGIGGSFLTDMIMKAVGTTDPETREMIEGGLFNLSLNNALSSLYGETIRTDFSDSLRLLDPELFTGWTSLIDSEVGEVLSSNASMSLVLGQNPRVTNFVKQMMRPFTVSDDKKPEELQLLGVSFLNLFSGTSNFLKAKYASENLKTISSKGKVIDYHVNAVEAFLKASGFNTIDEVNYYASQEEIYRTSQKFKDDIKVVVDEIYSRLAAKGISQEEQGYYLDIMAEAQRAFKNDPVYMKEFSQQIYYKALAGEDSLYRVLRSMSGYMDAQEFENMVMKSPVTDEAKSTLIQAKRMFGVNNGN